MQYLDGDASALKPLDIDTVSGQYFGAKAWDYNVKNADTAKWKAEYVGISEGLKGCTGSLLDIPCGTGRFFPIYRECGLQFVGVDISDDMLHQARTDYPWANVEKGDFRTLELPEKGFDVTVCSQFLKFLPEHELVDAIARLGRATRHRMLISIMTGDHVERRSRCYVHPISLFDRAVRTVGFELKARGDIEPPHHHLWICEAT